MAEKNEICMSIAGGSGWDCSLCLGCPQKHFLKYEQGWRLRRMPGYFAFGIAVHESFFAKDRNRFREIWESGRIFQDEDSDGWPIDREDEDVEADIQKANDMLDVLDEQEIEFADIEKGYSTPLINPDDGKVPEGLENITVKGRRDMLEKINGREELSDLKTGKARWHEDKAKGSIQLPTYRYLEAATGETVHDHGNYLILTKAKEPKFQRLPVTMGDSDFFAVFEQFKAAGEMLNKCRETGVWPKHRNNCLGVFQQLCDYHPLCFPGRYSNPEEEVNKTLECRR